MAGAYDITDIFLIRNFDALMESGLLEFKVPMVCILVDNELKKTTVLLADCASQRPTGAVSEVPTT